MNYEDVLNELDGLSEEKFKAFTVRLLRTRRFFYGVRTPLLRKLGRRIRREYPDYITDFFGRENVSHEEILLAGWQTGKDYPHNITLLSRLVPLMDSWAQTDQVIYKFAWAKDKSALIRDLSGLTACGEFGRRAFIVALMTNCMTESDFHLIEEYLPGMRFGEYYVDMAAAWLLCEGVIKMGERGEALLSAPFVTPSVLSKAKSKMRDSFRI